MSFKSMSFCRASFLASFISALSETAFSAALELFLPFFFFLPRLRLLLELELLLLLDPLELLFLLPLASFDFVRDRLREEDSFSDFGSSFFGSSAVSDRMASLMALAPACGDQALFFSTVGPLGPSVPGAGPPAKPIGLATIPAPAGLIGNIPGGLMGNIPLPIMPGPHMGPPPPHMPPIMPLPIIAPMQPIIMPAIPPMPLPPAGHIPPPIQAEEHPPPAVLLPVLLPIPVLAPPAPGPEFGRTVMCLACGFPSGVRYSSNVTP
mmetsp:Transcript_18196/g.42334  ORF Transcript_18196/g.42334 Transcript_18196/m.42334 type:complete len:265 (-) Transcript_18196:693-1487(-)